MHELSIMESILDTAQTQAQANDARQIHRISLQIGDLSGIVPEALRFAFETCTANTIAAGATLEIEKMPAICHCQQCDRDFTPTDWIYVCPECEQPSADIRQGRELKIIAIEIS